MLINQINKLLVRKLIYIDKNTPIKYYNQALKTYIVTEKSNKLKIYIIFSKNVIVCMLLKNKCIKRYVFYVKWITQYNSD